MYMPKPEGRNIPFIPAYLIGEGIRTCIYHITFIQRFAIFDCGLNCGHKKE